MTTEQVLTDEKLRDLLLSGKTQKDGLRAIEAAVLAKLEDKLRDAERFAWDCTAAKTGSDALIRQEIRRLNGDVPTLDEYRAAYDEAMSTPYIPAIDAARKGE